MRPVDSVPFAIQAALIGFPKPLSFGRTASALAKNQWLPPDDLERLRINRLTKLLGHAATRCPYYRTSIRGSWPTNGELRTREVLKELPTIDRRTIQTSIDSMVDETRDLRQLQRLSTGGTTGSPMPFYVDDAYRLYSRALCARLYSTFSRQPFSRTFLLAGSPIDSNVWMDLGNRVKNALRRTVVHPAFELTEDHLPAVVAAIRKAAPRFLLGYTSALHLLARYCLATGDEARVDTIVPLAELVTDVHRQAFSRAFGAETCEIYGAREATGLAAECRQHRGMHVQDDSFIVEILRGDQPADNGSPGEIVITDLANYAMPLLRYRIGDIGVLSEEPCPCGRSFSLLRITHGRRLDVIVTRAGTLLPGEYFPHLFKEVSREVEAFTVHQRTLELIEIEMVVKTNATGELEDYLESRIRDKLGPDVKLNFARVPELRREKSGKFRPTRSDVPLPW